jgi:hypothetical protein
MAKSHKNRSSKKSSRSSKKSGLFKGFKNTTSRAVPMLKTGLKSVGSTVKNVAVKSVPTVNKGLEGVYGAMATGFNMGIKGVTGVTKGISKLGSKRSGGRSSRRRRGGSIKKY